MLWILSLLVGVEALLMEEDDHVVKEVSDCLTAISERFLESRCMSFLFPFNFSDPSVAGAHPLVRSSLLKSVHSRWAPYLPKVNTENMHLAYMKPDLGPVRYLRCAHIIIFDDDLSYIVQANRILYTFYSHYYEDGAGKNSRMVVAVTGEVRDSEVHELLFYMFKMGDIDVVFVGIKAKVITVFTLFPFGRDRNSCHEDNTNVEILDVWIDGDFARHADLFPYKIPKIFNNCSFKVGTVHHPPHFMFDKEGKPSSGIEYYIIEMIAEHMGLRPDYWFYRNKSVSWLWIEKDGPHGVSVDLRRGEVWILVSGNNNFIFTFSSIVVPHAFLAEHLCWFFKNPAEVQTWKLIFMGFNQYLWIMVIAAIVLFPYCLFLIAKVQRRKHPFQRLSTSMIVSYGLVVAIGSSVEPRTNVFRIVFISWFFYAIHINLAFSASLTSLMTAGKMEPKISSFEDVIERKLTTAMEQNIEYQTLEIDEPIIRKVLSRRVINDDMKMVYDEMMEHNNLSLLQLDLPYIYKVKKDNLQLYNSEFNLGFIYIGFKMRRNHFAIDRFAELSTRVMEGGFTSKFIKDYTSVPKLVSESNISAFTLVDFSGPLFILLVGSLVSFLFFIGELFTDYINRRSEHTEGVISKNE